MIKKKKSIHLQDYPELNFLKNDNELVEKMDLVRSVCSSALSIRDNKNLRVRLPLKELTVIGKNAFNIQEFKDIIAEEVNVKSINFKNNIEDLAELKLAINFKKIGAKMGPKIKEIMAAVKSGEWKKLSEEEIEIAGVSLKGDDFSLKLTPKNTDDKEIAIQALSDNSHLISLDIKITEDLKQEGIARDIVRLIQQARKDANLDVSDRIRLTINSSRDEVSNIVDNFSSYIKQQVLADEVTFNKDIEKCQKNSTFFSKNKAEDVDINIAIFK